MEGVGTVFDAPALGAGDAPVLGSRAVACRDAIHADAVIADTWTLLPLARRPVGLRLRVAGASAAAPGLAWTRIGTVVGRATPDTLTLVVTFLHGTGTPGRTLPIAAIGSALLVRAVRRTARRQDALPLPADPPVPTLGPVLLQRMDALAVAVTQIFRAGVAIIGAGAAPSLVLDDAALPIVADSLFAGFGRLQAPVVRVTRAGPVAQALARTAIPRLRAGRAGMPAVMGGGSDFFTRYCATLRCQRHLGAV